jgi:hypothetical protein
VHSEAVQRSDAVVKWIMLDGGRLSRGWRKKFKERMARRRKRKLIAYSLFLLI